VLRHGIQAHAFLEVGLGLCQLTKPEQHGARPLVRFQEAHGVLQTLGQTLALLAQLPRCLELCPLEIKRVCPTFYT